MTHSIMVPTEVYKQNGVKSVLAICNGPVTLK